MATREFRCNGNSGNYLSLIFGYAPDIAIKTEDVNVYPSMSIVPMFGLRRDIGKHFNFEFAFGLGYNWTFKEFDYVNYVNGEPMHYDETEKGMMIGLRLALGYRF